MGVVCALAAAYFLWRGRPATAGIVAILAVGLVLLALTVPTLLRFPSALWWRFSRVLGWLNARVLLFFVFLLILTPVGLSTRLVGWDPLGRGKRASGSGWVPYPKRQRDLKHYERMY